MCTSNVAIVLLSWNHEAVHKSHQNVALIIVFQLRGREEVFQSKWEV